jgi:hypothetical protein
MDEIIRLECRATERAVLGRHKRRDFSDPDWQPDAAALQEIREITPIRLVGRLRS